MRSITKSLSSRVRHLVLVSPCAASLLATALPSLSLAQNVPPASPAAPTTTPVAPSAPTPPPAASVAMMRSDPKIREMKLEDSLYGASSAKPSRRLTPGQQVPTGYQSTPYRFGPQSKIAFPVLLRTSWCDTDFTTLDARITIDGMQTRLDPATVFTRSSTGPEANLVFPIQPQNTQGQNEIRTTAVWRVQRWELDVDENMAARSTWPRKWDAKLERYLQKEFGIDPTIPAVLTIADGATPGGARSASPFIAARNAVAAIAGRFKSISGGTSEFCPDGSLRGIAFSPDNTAWGVEAGRGSPIELCATCVAGLRAIGIPARMVYCIDEDGQTQSQQTRSKFRFIGEIFLNDIGWIPFDPMEMRMKGIATRMKNGPIKGFANVDGLEDCTPFAFKIVPDGYERADRYAVWGWRAPGVSVDSNYAITRITLTDSSRGNGKVPSMPAPVGDEGP
jgi:hypothetical protein